MLKKFTLLLSAIALISFIPPISANANSHAKSLNNLGVNEIMFAQMMIPHHQQTIDMSTLSLRNSSNPTIKALAKKSSKIQKLEIAQMRYLITSNNASVEVIAGMGIEGMLSISQLKNLGTLKSEEIALMQILLEKLG